MKKYGIKFLTCMILTAAMVFGMGMNAFAKEGVSEEVVRNQKFTTYAQMKSKTGNADKNAWTVRYLTEVEQYYWNFSQPGHQEDRTLTMNMVSNAYQNLEMFLDNGYLLDYQTLKDYAEDYKVRKGEEDAYYLILTDALKNPYLLNKPKAVVTATTYNGRDYSAVFDADFYYENNPELQKTIGKSAPELLRHFVEKGINEGKAGNATFDMSAYTAQTDAQTAALMAGMSVPGTAQNLNRYSYSPANYYGKYLGYYDYTAVFNEPGGSEEEM